ncbi:MAG: hypothetical protein JSS27_19380 [Planctomycetes bacterium]|nr:hypothetical protein [Planctomycetota bacterium]
MSILQDPTGILILGVALMSVALTSALRGLVSRAAAQEAARRRQLSRPHATTVIPLGAHSAPRRQAA